MTQRYANLSKADRQHAVDKLDDVLSLSSIPAEISLTAQLVHNEQSVAAPPKTNPLVLW